MGLRLNLIMAAVLGAASAPSLPSGLVAKFSADSITPQTDNTALGTWTDEISGLSATQGTGASQPLYRASRLNGKPSVQFTGAKWLAGAFPALKAAIDTGTYTVMIVMNNIVVQSNGCVFGNTATNGFCYQATGAYVGRFDTTVAKTTAPYTGSGFVTFGTTSSATSLYSGQSGTGNEFVYINGMRVGELKAGQGPITSSATGNFAFGARDDTGALTSKGDMYEVLVWNRVLSDVEWIAAQKWASTKYGQAYPWASATSIDVYVGDSISAGVNSNDISKTPSYLSSQARGRSYGQYAMHAIGGVAWGALTTHVSDWAAISNAVGLPINVVAFEWYNEKNTGNSDAVAWTHAQAWISAVRAYPTPSAGPIKIGLMSSTAYSGDASTYATVRGPYNTSCDGAGALVDSYFGIHTDATAGPLIGNSTAVTNNGTTYIGADGVHPTVAGYAVLAPCMTSCLNGLRA